MNPYLKAIRDAIPPECFAKIVAGIVKDAEAGDPQAISLLRRYRRRFEAAGLIEPGMVERLPGGR